MTGSSVNRLELLHFRTEICLKTITSTFAQVILLIGLSVVATMRVSAAEQGTSAATKARMIQLITMLESDPFLKDGKEVRGEVMSWLA